MGVGVGVPIEALYSVEDKSGCINIANLSPHP